MCVCVCVCVGGGGGGGSLPCGTRYLALVLSFSIMNVIFTALLHLFVMQTPIIQWSVLVNHFLTSEGIMSQREEVKQINVG